MNIDRITAYAQVALAFFYGICFLLTAVFALVFWNQLSKIDVGIASMIATGFMNQSKDASAFFFARHRPPTDPTEGKLP